MSLSLPYREDVNQWSVEQLSAWLQQREMPEIADIYLRKGIDGHKMITLAEGEHITILASLALRKRLDFLSVIQKIKNHRLVSNGQQKSPLRKVSQSRKFSYPSATPNSLRYGAAVHLSPAEHTTQSEVEAPETSLPDTVNEDYLVPLSTGLGSLPSDTPTQPQTRKKHRCPSPPPPPPPQNKVWERNKIQDLELPEPPRSNKMNQNVAKESMKKYSYYGCLEMEESEKGLCDVVEANKEDCNAYEIIQDTNFGQQVLESRNGVETQPQGLTSAPVVPVRTHASTNSQKSPIYHRRFLPLHSDAPPREDRTMLPHTSRYSSGQVSSPRLPRKAMQGGLPRTLDEHSPVKSSIANTTRSHHPDSRVPPLPDSSIFPEVLQLEGNESVPVNSLYRSLMNKEYFHLVARKAVGEMLTENGMFLVRPSTHSQHLLTLSVSSKGKIFNIVIRCRSDSKFALGSEKQGEIAFSSVEDMIRFYKREPIKVQDGSLVYLRRSPQK